MTETLNLTRRATLGLIAATATVTAMPVFAQDAVAIEEMSVGDADAPITVIEYASYTCPHCSNFHADVYPNIKENYIDTGKVRMIFRSVYFDRLGLWADLMARCGGPDRYVGVAGMIYEKQREWTAGETALDIVDNLKAIGRLAGMNDADLDACMQDNDTAQALVTNSTADMEEHGINATPMFVINGETVSNMGYSDFADTFEAILN